MTTPTSIDAAGLAMLLAGPKPPLLIDVRLEADFSCTRLSAARNNCVFEVAFLERLAGVAPDPQAPVCVYGAGTGSLESRVAAEKLSLQGYREVYDLSGGIDGWIAAGLPVERLASPALPPSPVDGVHPIDLGASQVRWIGRNLLNRHEGGIGLKGGSLRFEQGRLAGGEFTLDMRAITCSDLADTELHEVLIHHLSDPDFFDVETYPEATFIISRAEEVAGASKGSPNVAISGILTLKGVPAAVDFMASAGLTEEGRPAAQAAFAIDRTRWNVFYGSGKWFHRLGGHLVNDLIELQVRIVGG